MSFVSRLLLLELLVVACSGQVSYHFNNSLAGDCLDAAAPCSFLNASLWVPVGVPAANDTIDIYRLSSNPPLQFAFTSPINIDTLTANNVFIAARANASISVLFSTNCTITISNNSTFYGQYLRIEKGSVVTVKDWSQLLEKLRSPQFILDVTSSLKVLDHATFSISANLYGAFEFQAETTISITYFTTFNTSSAIIAAPLTGVAFYLYSTFISLTAPVSVQDTVYISGTFQLTGAPFNGGISVDDSDSLAVFSNCPSIVFNGITGAGVVRVLTSSLTVLPYRNPIYRMGALVLGGIVSANFTGVALANISSTTGSNNENPNITLIADGLTTFNYANITGQVLVQGQGLTVLGTVVVNGQLNVMNSNVTLGGSLQGVFDNPITNGTLYANLALSPNSNLTVSTGSTGTLFGTLVNDGHIDIASDRTLQIWGGDYIQGNTTLYVTLVTGKENTPCLDVLSGSIILNNQSSTLAYTVPYYSSAASFVVARANVAISGSFAGDAAPLPASRVTRPLPASVDYVAKTITIQYDLTTTPPVGQWFIALVAGVGGVVVIALLSGIFFCIRRRNRSAYVRVPQ